MITLELPAEYEVKLQQLAQDERQSPATIIEEALRKYFAIRESHPTAYELGKDVFGKYGSKQDNLSIDYKSRVKQKLHAKHAH